VRRQANYNLIASLRQTARVVARNFRHPSGRRRWKFKSGGGAAPETPVGVSFHVDLSDPDLAWRKVVEAERAELNT
jgi:hypothetical protein